MNPRVTQCASATMAAALLALSATQAGSQPVRARQNCNSNPDHNAGTNCYPGSAGYVCSDRTSAARIAATGQPPTCQGDGPCTDPCPPHGTQDGPNTQIPPARGQSGTPQNDGEDYGDRGGHGGGLLPWLIGGGLIAGTILAADHLTGKKWASPDELDVHGPRFPVEQKLGRFQVQGYAAGGWPLAVDIYTEPGTRTWLDVRYKGQDEPEAIDLTRPDGGRRIEFIQLPGIPGVVKVARYSLHSALIRPGQEPLYRPMKIYGIGAGPNAAGAIDARQSSLRIEGVHARFGGGAFALRSGSAPIWLASAPADFGTDLGAFAFAAAGADPQPPRVGSYLSVTAFGPQYPSRPADVSWAVAARQPFQRSELEVLQLPRDGDGKFIAVVRADLDLFAKPQAFGSWGGTPGLMNVGAGTYLLQARAWRTRAGGGDWTGAFGPDYVYIR